MDGARRIDEGALPERMGAAVSLAWSLFARKVGGGLVKINKEASMQLQLGYVLQQLSGLIALRKDEEVRLELESAAKVRASTRQIDILLTGQCGTHQHRIAVELKCYRTLASSGGLRGATDIFMKDVYEDLATLEAYVDCGHAEEGVALVMTDLERLVRPRNKKAKCWNYDISDGAICGPARIDTPIGGKAVVVELAKRYVFEWLQYGPFWFLELRGQEPPSASGDRLPFKATPRLGLEETTEGA